MHNSFIQKAQSLLDENKAYATAYIVRRKKPSSGKPGDKAIITDDGKIHGWIGGGCTRGIVLKEALAALQDRKPRLVSIRPNAVEKLDTHTKLYTMTCQSGGEVDVYIEPVLPNPKIRIFGASHIAMALERVAKSMEYHVEVVTSELDSHQFPNADRHSLLSDFDAEQADSSFYTVVCTQGEGDNVALLKGLRSSSDYLGFVASRMKANALFLDLKRQGVSFDDLKKIKTPAGKDINAKTPHEVAISILAEIIEHFRKEKTEEPNAQNIKLGDDYYMNPVCNIPVQKSTAKHIIEYKDEKVYFCCDGCKVSFEKAPEKYMAQVH